MLTLPLERDFKLCEQSYDNNSLFLSQLSLGFFFLVWLPDFSDNRGKREVGKRRRARVGSEGTKRPSPGEHKWALTLPVCVTVINEQKVKGARKGA